MKWVLSPQLYAGRYKAPGVKLSINTERSVLSEPRMGEIVHSCKPNDNLTTRSIGQPSHISFPAGPVALKPRIRSIASL
jgi:hypothetical protein